MKNNIMEKLIELKIKDRESVIIINPESTQSENELLDNIAAQIANKKALIIFCGDNITDKKFFKLGEKVKLLCAEFDATFLIQNRTDIAFLLEADGVYLNENGISVEQARLILGENAIIIESLQI